MEPYLDWQEEEYEETIQTKYPLHKYQQNPQKNSVNYSSKNYLKTNKILQNQGKKKIINIKQLTLILKILKSNIIIILIHHKMMSLATLQNIIVIIINI